MSLFTDRLKSNGLLPNDETPGNESKNTIGADSVLVASAALLEAELAITDGLAEGQKLEFEMAIDEEAIARIDSALNAIGATAAAEGAKPALTAQSLAILDNTCLQDMGVKSTGLESDSTLGPVETTEEIILGLEAMGSDAWKSMKETFFKFLDWIQKQFNSLFGGLERLKSKAKAVKDKEEKFDGKISNDKIKVSIGDLVKGNGANNKTISTAIGTDIEALNKIITEAIPEIEAKASIVVDKVEDAINKSAEDWGKDITDGTSAEKAISDAYGDVVTEVKKIAKNDDLIGGRTIAALATEAENYAGSNKLKLDIKAPTTGVEPKEISPLDRTKIAEVCDAVISGCEDLIASRKKILDTKKFKSAFEKIVSGAEKLGKDSEYKSHASKIRQAAKVAQSCGMIANGVWRNKLMTQSQRVMSTAVTYADKSLKKA